MTIRAVARDFIQDIRFAVRQFRRDKTFTAVCVLTLALGIGATTTLFTVLNAVVLQPLNFRDSERLVDIASEWQGSPGAISVGDYFVIRDRSRTLETVAARSGATFNLADASDPERIQGARVSASYFKVFGSRPLLGRVFTEAEDDPGGAPVALLSEGLFARRFGSDPSWIGRSVALNGTAHTILGVMPRDFSLPEDGVEIWTPIAFGAERSFDAHYLTLTARLRIGASEAQLQEDVHSLTGAVREAAPRENDGRRLTAVRLIDRIVGDYRARLFVLLGAVSLVFLIACVNVASLSLARGSARLREIAVRAALGAVRSRIARQLMTEALLLSILGAAAGLWLAGVTLPIVIAQSPADVPRLANARIDPMAILVACAGAVVATLITGLWPALRESRAGLSSSAGRAARGVTGGARDRTRQTFVAVEVALSLMLLMGAGLLIRSADNLARVPAGFDAPNLLSARVALPISAYPGEERPAAAVSRMVAALTAAPGVAEAAASTRPPLIGDVSYGLRIEGRGVNPRDRIDGRMQLVTPGYLETMRVRLLQGRTLKASDRRDSPRVMVISETLARLAFADANPIGRRIACCESTDGQPVWKEVVGVVADTRARGLSSPGLAEFYMSMDQAPRRAFEANGGSITLVARASNGQPETIAAAVRGAVRSVDPGLPLYDVATMSARLAASTAITRFNRGLLSCLGAVGLALTGIGIYGVIAYLASQRTKELSLRMALGARKRDVVGLVVRQGFSAVLAGLLLGAFGVFAQGQAIQSLVFGVSGRDALTFGVVSALLLVVALSASLIPAWRTARINPAAALSES